MHWRWFRLSLPLLEIFSSHRNGWAMRVRENEISTRVYLAWPIRNRTKFRNWFCKRWLKWTIFSLTKPVRWRFQVRECVFLRSDSVEFVLDVELTDQLTVKNARDLKKCTSVIQEFVLGRLNETIAMKLIDSINVLHDNYVGTLTRCLFSLETNGDDDESELSASKALQEVVTHVSLASTNAFVLCRFSILRIKWMSLSRRIPTSFKC